MLSIVLGLVSDHRNVLVGQAFDPLFGFVEAVAVVFHDEWPAYLPQFSLASLMLAIVASASDWSSLHLSFLQLVTLL